MLKPRIEANTVAKERLNANYGNPKGNTSKDVSSDDRRPILMNQDTFLLRTSNVLKITIVSNPQAVDSQIVKIVKTLTRVNSVPKDNLNASSENLQGNTSKILSVHESRPTSMNKEISFPRAFNVGKF